MDSSSKSWAARFFGARADHLKEPASKQEFAPEGLHYPDETVAPSRAANAELELLLAGARIDVGNLGTLSGKLAERGMTALSVTSEIASNLANGTEQAASASALAREIAGLSAATARSTAEIQAFIKDANALMQDLATRAVEIGNVRAEIAQIAAQTRFLALNAQIEAGRAGEQGVPFGVIASEVGKLSSKVMSASNLIGARLGNVADGLASSAKVVNDMDRRVNQLDQQTRETARASYTLSDVIAKVDATVAGINSNFETVVNNCFADIIEQSMEVQSDAERISCRLGKSSG